MTTAAKAAATLMTVGQVARRLGVDAWMVARVCDRGLVPEPARVGRNRVFAPEELPGLRLALAGAGYLSHEALLEQTARDGEAAAASR